MIDVSLLNENQKEAVLSEEKYLRVIAGAGSGKTRVLTMRIAHLIQDLGTAPFRILAITFTNKAANEMKERVKKMLEDETSAPWISTIHSLCVRILREDIQVMGYPRNFTIMDAEDQKTVLKEAYKQFDIDATSFPYSAMLDYIGNNKAVNLSVEHAYELAGTLADERAKAKVYEFYLKRQKELYALDFDDLILWTVRMFQSFDEVLEKWQRRFEYVLVDEFQDIDKTQYKLIRLLTGERNSLCVVGDPDQTIYTWRGADVNIIMNYERDYPDAHTVVLNENYRSTEYILRGANSVIQNNKHRVKKDLFTNRKSDKKITHYASAGEDYQAAWVAQKIRELHTKGKAYHDIAVLYRSNYLSRSLEKGLIDERIPYIIYGGIRFYERQEVKDALCYLRMAANGDDLALQRIINRPKRGVGNKSLDKIADKAREKGCSMYEILRDDNPLSGKTKEATNTFVSMVEKWRGLVKANELETFKLFEMIIDDSGYRAMLEENKETERIENLKELIDDVKQFSENYPESTLDEYLQMISLYGDREENTDGDYVQLMTVHAAKGLEFDTVFVTDLNDGIFPNERAMNEGNRGVEEERRLAYVAFTRAMNKLYLTEAAGFSYILQKVRTRSRFINEIDEDCIEHIGLARPQTRDNVRKTSMSFADFERSQNVPERDRDTSRGSSYEPIEEHNTQAKNTLLKKGEVVIHSKFGEGIVIRCTGGIAEIAFPYPYGVKKIAAGHPTLKKKSELKS